MKKLILSTLTSALFIFLPICASGQEDGGDDAEQSSEITDVETRNKFWECNLPGGDYVIQLGTISSVSLHQYVVQGTVKVYEATVSSRSSVVARFYFMEPITDGGALSSTKTLLNRATKLAETAASRTNTDKVWEKVVKDYPTSTHAHTVEYRLKYKDDLQKLYGSVKRSWMTGRGHKITIKE